jgi:dTDP-4-amino-4,6-dideoxygalactose transaminase
MNKNNSSLAINGGPKIAGHNILIHVPYLNEHDFKAVETATRSTFVSGDGPDCRKFEKMLCDYLGVKHALFVNSATTALELAFRVKNFPEGGEVICPDFTYTSTAVAALYNNLKIVLADVYPDNGSLDITKLESYITDKTVAIAAVDYGGIPAEMDEIMSIAKKHNLFVVHDTAQSIGSLYKGKRTGSQGDVSTFSFHGTKNLTTGEGGAFITNDDSIAERVKILREKGTDKYSFLTDNKDRGYYEYIDIGNSYVQSNINGALGVTQLQKLDWMNAERKKIAEYYLTELSGIEGLGFPRITKGSDHNWHLFGILVEPESRYWVMDALRAEGIMVNVHYTPLHRNRFYRDLSNDDLMPGSMQFYYQLLRLPIYPSMTQEEIQWVVSGVKKVFYS